MDAFPFRQGPGDLLIPVLEPQEITLIIDGYLSTIKFDLQHMFIVALIGAKISPGNDKKRRNSGSTPRKAAEGEIR